MKHLLLIVFLSPICLAAQETATTESGKKVKLKPNGTWEYVLTKEEKSQSKTKTLDRKVNGNDYHFTQVVSVENGHDEKVEVTFSASVPKAAWDELVTKKGLNEADYFSFIANMLTIDAQFTLKNSLSFQPFTKQFFMYREGKFICNYKMTGKNGYGNSVETQTLVKYDPNEY